MGLAVGFAPTVARYAKKYPPNGPTVGCEGPHEFMLPAAARDFSEIPLVACGHAIDGYAIKGLIKFRFLKESAKEKIISC